MGVVLKHALLAVLVSGSATAMVSTLVMGSADVRDDSKEAIQVVSGATIATPTLTNDALIPTALSVTPNGCVTGTWSAAPKGAPIRRETAHFALRWNNDAMTAAQATTLSDRLEHVFDVYTNVIGFPSPDCSSAIKRKINVTIDPTYGATGGLDGDGIASFWASDNIVNDYPTMAHEFTHALQGASGGLRDSPYVGWFWESHAEWMASQVPELRKTFTGCGLNTVLYPHFLYGYTPHRYCGWQFLEYLKDRKGYSAVNDLWTKSPRPSDANRLNVDVLSILMKNMNWSVAQLNDTFGDWAMHNVNWDYINPDGSDQGVVYRAAFGRNDDVTGYKRLRVATLDPVDLSVRRFAIPFSQAPQRFGYNLVRLYPDAGTSTIGVAFKGVVQAKPATTVMPGLANEPTSIPMPASGWRWGLVAIDAQGRSRYSGINAATSGALSMPVIAGDKSFWMVVLGAPTQNLQAIWSQAYYSLYRYPWMAQFTGAMPEGYQANAPKPTAGGRTHPNGGGWVAAGATVAATAYVGPYAKVLGGSVSGMARVEDHAIVENGTVQDRAVVGGQTLIAEGSVIKGDAKVSTVFEGIRASTVSGTAQNLGDANYYGFSMARGAFYGEFTEQAQFGDPQRGANRNLPVAEVTATPSYRW